MTETQKGYLKWGTGLVIAALLLMFAGVGINSFFRPSPASVNLGHGGPFESNNYPNAIGSTASPALLTSAYNGASSTVIMTTGDPNMAIGVTYLPKSQGSQLYLEIQRSIDQGATFLPYGVISYGSTSTLVFMNGASSTNGIPYMIPSGGQSTSGTTQFASFDLTMVADFVKFRAKEDTSSTHGTVNVEFLATSN